MPAKPKKAVRRVGGRAWYKPPTATRAKAKSEAEAKARRDKEKK